MSSLRLFLDYLWPPPLFSHPMVVSQQRDTSDNLPFFMNRHDLFQYSTHPIQVPSVVRHRTLRRKRAESVDYAPQKPPSPFSDPLSSSRRESPDPTDPPHSSLRDLRDRRRADEDPAPAKGFTRRIHDLETSCNEQRKLADDRQRRLSSLEKENADLRAKLDTTQKHLKVLQSANTSFASNVTKLERELQGVKIQHSSCKTRISTAESRYTTLLAANTVLQNSYNDLRASHNALQSASTSVQLSHSALLFSTSTSYTPPPPPIPRRSTPPPPNSPIDRPIIPPVPPVPTPVPLPVPPRPQVQLKPKQLDVITPPVISRESSSQTSPISAGTSFSRSSDDSSASHVSRLKTLLNDRTSELNTLQAFLSKHDSWSGAQVVQAVNDLNGELARLASDVTEYFVVGSDIDSDCSDPASVATRSSFRPPTDKSGQEIHSRLKEALGSTFYNLIFTCSDAPSDPTSLVQYAIQAWEVWCCSRILDGFCFGLPSEVERLLADVWENMKREELQPMSSRWRGLTHEYLRGVLSSATPSYQLPTPPASPSISALYKSQQNEPLSIRTLQERELFDLNIRGILTILSGVGLEVDHTPLPPLIRRSPATGSDFASAIDGSVINASKVVDGFGDALKRIQGLALELATVTKEGVMSGWFEITRVPRAATLPTPTPTPSQQVWTPQASTPQKGGRRATVDIPPRRSEYIGGDRRMSESSSSLPLFSPQSPSRLKDNDRTAIYSPNPNRTPTHTPSANRSPNLDHPYTPSPPSSYTPRTPPSTHRSPSRPRDGKAALTKFDHNTMENVFQGFGREDAECGVMCTIELGLDCVRKVVSDEDLGVMFSPIDSPVTLPGLGLPEKGTHEVETMERRTLVKPKVLLENVVEIMR